MAQAYAKIFRSLFDGSLRGRSDEILVFVNILTHTYEDGVCDRHFRAISDETGISLPRVRAAIRSLEAKDPESRSKELDGARLERLDQSRDWGWRIVNFFKYRELGGDEEYRVAARERMRKFRALRNVTQPLHPLRGVTDSHGSAPVHGSDLKDESMREGTRKLSGVERVGLEKELESNRNILSVLSKDDFPDAGQRAEKKRLKDRNKAIEKALHIPL